MFLDRTGIVSILFNYSFFPLKSSLFGKHDEEYSIDAAVSLHQRQLYHFRRLVTEEFRIKFRI